MDCHSCCWQKKLSLSITLLVIWGICTTLFAVESKNKPLKIRVGFFEFDGYHQILEDGTKTGYGYDFLQMIAPYGNFEYEYVGYDKSWSEMQKMLENGEIDLLTSAQKTPPREEIFDYSNRSIGFSATLVTTLPSNTGLTTADFSTFENIRVGLLKNNSRNTSFDNFAKRNGFSYIPVYFEDQILMAKALQNRQIDVMVTSDLRTIGNEIVVTKFDDSPFYAIVKDGNTELLGRVNAAIEMLSSDFPDWIHNLFYKYYKNSYNGNEIVLMPEEKEYLNSLKENNTPIKVLINPDRAPYSYIEKKKPKGIFVDLLESVSNKIGLTYEIIDCQTVKDYENIIRSDGADIVFGTVIDSFTAEIMGYHVTNSFHTTSLSCVTRVNDTKTHNRVAVNEGMSILNKRYIKLYGDCEQVKCYTIKDCMNAVKKGKADCTYVYTYTASKYVFEDAKGILAYSPVSDTLTNVGIAVQDSTGPILFHLMNRIASTINEDELQMIIANNTHFDYAGNPLTYLVYRQPVIFVLIILLISAAITITIILQRNKQRRIDLLLLKETREKREALELACEAAEKANRAKSDFLSKMSHDIRTPMNAIVGLTAIAKAHVNDPETTLEYLSKITSSSNHLLALINDVLDMSKIESGTFSLSYEEFNIIRLIDQLVEIVAPEVKAHKHNLEVHTENLMHENVIGDTLHIQQVFVNIVGNSIKYTPDGGKIEIYVKELESNKPKIGIFEFTFKDNGIGMNKEFLKTVFEPFSREKDTRVNKIQGTGLGLAITKNIVTMMGGTIKMDSEQDQGTTTTIILKMKLLEKDINDNLEKVKNGENETLSISNLESLDFTGKKILLVDDNAINREIATEILKLTNVEVSEAEDGKIAFEMFSKSPEHYYSMIFMDVQMPVLNGYNSTIAIRNLPRNDAKTVPIIAMTADAFTEDVEKASKSGMNEHIAKPLDIKKLAAVMQKWMK